MVTPNDHFPPSLDEIKSRLTPFCQRHHIARLEVFGSLLGCEVDLLTRRSVEQDENSIRRRSILEFTRELYAIAAFEYGIRAAPQEELLNRAKVREVMLRLLEQKPASAAAANALGELEIRELEIR